MDVTTTRNGATHDQSNPLAKTLRVHDLRSLRKQALVKHRNLSLPFLLRFIISLPIPLLAQLLLVGAKLRRGSSLELLPVARDTHALLPLYDGVVSGLWTLCLPTCAAAEPGSFELYF